MICLFYLIYLLILIQLIMLSILRLDFFCILKYVGICRNSLKLSKTSFSNRTQRVHIDNVLSELGPWKKRACRGPEKQRAQSILP